MRPANGSASIGKSIVIRGELSGSEDLFIDGEVQGSVTLSGGLLTVGPSAKIEADLSAREILIFGQVKGTLRAAERVDLRQAGGVIGDLYASRLAIEDGAQIRGRVELSGQGSAPAGALTPGKA